MHSLNPFILRIAICAALLAAPCARAATWYVSRSAALDTQNGLAWSSAYITIQPAIDAAFADGGGEVWIAEGVYSEPRSYLDPDTGRNTGSLRMREGVSLYGGFAGTEISRSERDTLRRRTVIDGSAARGGEPARQVVVAASDTTLDGFEIRGGDAGFRSTIGGGVVIERRNNVRVAGCIITENTAGFGGGLRITFSENILIERCTITANHARGADVPGLYAADSTIEISDCTFAQNDFAGDFFDGGCVRVEGGSTRFHGCTFIRNTGTPLHFDARGGRSHEVLDCDFIENNGLGGPGALRYFGRSTAGDFRIERCSFLANVGDASTVRIRENGARLDNGIDFAKNVAVRNCSFVNNTGEGLTDPTVLVGGANFLFEFCTFGGNYTPTNISKGIVMHLSPDGTGGLAPLRVRNSIFWNASPEEFRFAAGGRDYTKPMIENSVVRGGFPGTDIFDTDPLFLDLATNDFRLDSVSPAVDAAQDFDLVGDDVFGSSRPAGPASDLGAHELMPEHPSLCESVAMSEEQFAQLMFAGDSFTDLDRDGLPELASLRLLSVAACSETGDLGHAADLAFSLNTDAADTEIFDTRVLRREALIAALMSVSVSAQAALRDALAESGAVLLNEYAIVSCGISARDCNAVLPAAPAGPNEALSGPGDFDGDGLTNAEEWAATVGIGGTLDDFITAATDQVTQGVSGGGGGGGGCFIATAAYGTSLSSEIDALRTVRDDRLLNSSIGAAFTDAYYRLSPPIADALATHDGLRTAMRKVLAPIVAAAQWLNGANPVQSAL